MKKKMMTKKMTAMLLCGMLIASLAFAGCGSSDRAYMESSANGAALATVEEAATSYGTYELDDSYYEEYDGGMDDAFLIDPANESSVSIDASASADSDYAQKLIKNYNLSIETKAFSDSRSLLEQKVASYGGYIENMSSYGYAPYRNANYTLRIPALKAEAFLAEAGDMGTIYSQSASQTDITGSYYDVAAHIEALKTQHSRLLELMSEATEMTDIIALEERLSDIEYQLGSFESQMKIYNTDVTYATIYLDLNETADETVIGNETFGEKISKGFHNSLNGVSDDIVNFIIWFVVNLPYIVIWLLILALVIFAIRKIRRKKVAKKEKMLQTKAETDESKKDKER